MDSINAVTRLSTDVTQVIVQSATDDSNPCFYGNFLFDNNVFLVATNFAITMFPSLSVIIEIAPRFCIFWMSNGTVVVIDVIWLEPYTVRKVLIPTLFSELQLVLHCNQ